MAQTCPPPPAPRRRGHLPANGPISPVPVSRGLHGVVIDGGELEGTLMGLSARCVHRVRDGRLTHSDTVAHGNPELHLAGGA
jgi:hypothetical protein